MDNIIVYVDDAQYAQPFLQTLAQGPRASKTQWIVVACAPRVTHRVSKFVSNRSRENWRNKWAEKLFQSCMPLLQPTAGQLQRVLAKGPLTELLQQLQAEFGPATQVIDLRRPKADETVIAPSLLSFSKIGSTLAGIGAGWFMLLGETMAA